MKRCTCVCLLLMFGVLAQVFSQSVEYTKRSKNEVRDGPGSYFQLLKVLPRGVAIPVLKRDGGWVNFRAGSAAGNLTPWISKNCLVEARPADLLRDLKIEWKSAKASPSAVAAAIRGFALRYGKVPSARVDSILDLQSEIITPQEFARFKVDTSQARRPEDASIAAELERMMNASEPSVKLDGLGLGIATRLAEAGLVANRKLVKYVNLIAAKIAEVSPFFDTPIRVYITIGQEPRAYAIPGGYIFVSEGLIRLCGDEAELSAVIAHEMTHLAARHAASETRQREHRVKMEDAFGELDEELGQNPDSSEADLEELIQASYDEVVKPRLQVYEEEADKGAALLLSLLGYDARAVAAIVAKTGRAIKSHEVDWSQNPFLHLDFEKRQDAVSKFLESNPDMKGGVRNAERFRKMLR